MTGKVSSWARGGRSALAPHVQAFYNRNLATYRADPTRLREDHAHETETVEAAYRKRQVVELIQNGADAMLLSPGGSIQVVLVPERVYCANTGEPLTAPGLKALFYSGLSPKRGKEIGRFGVGFKSVLAVTSRLTRTRSANYRARSMASGSGLNVGPR